MRVIIQRVSKAVVNVDGNVHSSITQGLLILLGVEEADTIADVEYLVKKISQLRIFSDDKGKMNLSVQDVNGGVLLVSQFTLHASTKKGNRPSFIKAARPDTAIPLYEKTAELFRTEGVVVKTGVFGADMEVELVNDGPVTVIIDSKNRE